MRKNIKRLVAVLMVMAMIISMCSTAFAAGHGSKKSSQGSYKSYTTETTDETSVEDPVLEESAEATEDQAVEETAEMTPEETVEETDAEATVEEEADIEEVAEAEDFSTGSVRAMAAGSPEDEAPAHGKNLYDNGDGTYTLALDVTGATSSSSTTEVTKANVILVLDTSNSMANNRTTYDGERMTRLAAEKRVLTDENGIIDNLLAQNVPGDAVKSDIIEVAIANFGTRGSTAQSFTTNASTLKTTINGLSNSQGTNWEEGLMRAEELADEIKASQPNEDVYVIFLTDGEPTTHNGSYNVNTNYATEWGYASDNARTIVTDGYKFYGIFTWGSGTSSHYLSSLVNYAYTGSGNSSSSLAPAYAQYFTDATDTDALIDALNQITHDITESVGYTNVELEDGITTMTASSVNASVEGEVTGLKYYRSGGSYGTADPEHGNYGTEWADAPAATINNEGRVDWDLGNTVLENGVTYTVTFVVWPSQASLDTVADLNNGKISYDSLTEDQKASIAVTGGKYVLKTNTDYPTVTYSTVKTKTVDGETTTVVSDPITMNITNPDPVSLAGSEMSIQKIWAVDLQTSRLQSLLYNEDGTSKKLTVTLDILKDNTKYGEVKLGWNEEEGKYVWADDAETIWKESFAVAPGVMTSNTDMAAYAKHTVTYGGTTYYILEEGHEYTLQENDFKDYHFDLVTEPYHPMVVNGELKNVKFGDNWAIESMTPENEELSSLDATNTLRGGINLNKVVLDPEGNEYPTDDEFTFTINLNNESEVFTGDSIPWYSVNGNYYHDDEGNYISEDEAKAKYGDNYESYGNALSGSATDVSGTITITSQDSVRIANVPVGTTYTVTETEVDGFTLNAIDHTIQLDGETTQESEATVDLEKLSITGEIVPNRENNITYKNKMNAFPAFYVYHSSDKTIEKVFVDDSRVTRTQDETTGLSTYTFDLANETKTGYLYGGYFKAYGGQKLTSDEIKALTYETEGSSGGVYGTAVTTENWASDSDGKAYTGSAATAWKSANAYTEEKGTAITPVIDEVYYLKEVPEEYISPYIYYVYDEYSPNHDLKKLYMITDTDDKNYTEVGIQCQKTTDDKSTTTLYSSIRVTKQGQETVYETLTAKNLSNTKVTEFGSVPRGYLAYWETNSLIKTNAEYKMIPYWKTLDGVTVTGISDRTVSIGNATYGEDGLSVSKETVASTAK